MLCFIASALLGVYHQNPTWSILLSSTLVMVVAYFIGLMLGAVAQRCVDDQVQKHKEDHPIPSDDQAESPESKVSTA